MFPYASKASKITQINLYNHERLHSLMSNYFENVFMFSMNDEVILTGFESMPTIFLQLEWKREIEKTNIKLNVKMEYSSRRIYSVAE